MDPYRTLLEINNAVIHCLSQAQLREAATAVIRRLLPCDEAALSFYAAPGAGPAAPFEPVLRRDGLRSHLTAPLIAQGEPVGVLGIGSLEPAKYSAEDAHFFEQVAAQLALVAGNVRAVEQLQGRMRSPNDASIAPPANDSLLELERRHISATLERCLWVIEGNRGAAKALGLHPNTLRHRLRKLELKRPSKSPT